MARQEARKSSLSVLAPAVDRGVSMRRRVVPGRSISRTLTFALVFMLLAAAAVWLYLNRWQDGKGNSPRPQSQAQVAPIMPTKPLTLEADPNAKAPEAYSPSENAAALMNNEAERFALDGRLADADSLISPDGETFAIRDQRGGVTLIHGAQYFSVNFKTPPSVMAFSPTSKTLACGFSKGEIALLSTESGKVTARRRVHRGAISGLTFTKGDELLLSSGADGFIRETSTLALIEDRRRSFGEPITGLSASSEVGRLWALGEDGALRAFSLISFEELSATRLASGASIAVASGLGVVSFAKGSLRVHDGASLRVLWEEKGIASIGELSAQENSVSLNLPKGLLLLSREKGEIATRRIVLGADASSISFSRDLRSALIVDQAGNASQLKS